MWAGTLTVWVPNILRPCRSGRFPVLVQDPQRRSHRRTSRPSIRWSSSGPGRARTCVVSDSKDPQRAHLAFHLRERVAVLTATVGGGDERFALPESIRMAFIEALQKNDMSVVWKAVEHEESLLAPVAC